MGFLSCFPTDLGSDIYAVGDCSFPHPLYEQRRMRLEMWRCARSAECAVESFGVTKALALSHGSGVTSLNSFCRW